MTLTLIRHGLTEGNLKRLYYGSTDLPLTEAGIAALHSDPPAAPKAQAYYTSGMRRRLPSCSANGRTRSCAICGRSTSAILRCEAMRS